MMITNTDNEHLIFENSVAQMEFKPKFFQNSVVHHLCRLSSLERKSGEATPQSAHENFDARPENYTRLAIQIFL